MTKSDDPPHWRTRVSATLAPYSRPLTAVFLLLAAIPLADSFIGPDVLGLTHRKAAGSALGILLLWYTLVAPDLWLAAIRDSQGPRDS